MTVAAPTLHHPRKAQQEHRRDERLVVATVEQEVELQTGSQEQAVHRDGHDKQQDGEGGQPFHPLPASAPSHPAECDEPSPQSDQKQSTRGGGQVEQLPADDGEGGGEHRWLLWIRRERAEQGAGVNRRSLSHRGRKQPTNPSVGQRKAQARAHGGGQKRLEASSTAPQSPAEHHGQRDRQQAAMDEEQQSARGAQREPAPNGVADQHPVRRQRQPADQNRDHYLGQGERSVKDIGGIETDDARRRELLPTRELGHDDAGQPIQEQRHQTQDRRIQDEGGLVLDGRIGRGEHGRQQQQAVARMVPTQPGADVSIDGGRYTRQLAGVKPVAELVGVDEGPRHGRHDAEVQQKEDQHDHQQSEDGPTGLRCFAGSGGHDEVRMMASLVHDG